MQINFKLGNNRSLPVSVWLPIRTYVLACVHSISFHESSGSNLQQAVLPWFQCGHVFQEHLKCLEKEKCIKTADYILAKTIWDDTLKLDY